MKIPIAALTLTLTGLSPSTTTAPPASALDAVGTVRKVVLMPPLEIQPHFAAPSKPVPMSALREQSTANAGMRLARMDDRVTNLKARADLSQARAQIEPDFEALKKLRAQVTTALTNLRNPEIGYDAAQKTLEDAIDELDYAIGALAMKLDRLDRAAPPNVS